MTEIQAICHQKNDDSFEVAVENLYPPTPHKNTEKQKADHIILIFLLRPFKSISIAVDKLETQIKIEELANKFIFLE